MRRPARGSDAEEQPVCPYCEASEYEIVGHAGIGNQVSLLRCLLCEGPWEEVLAFRYRRWVSQVRPFPGPSSETPPGRTTTRAR